MKTVNFASQKGFVALISAVLISALLMVLAASAACAASWARFGSLTRENKKIGAARAEGCVHLALLKIARDETVTWEQCEILSASEASPYVIFTRSVYQDTYTNLKIIAEMDDGGLVIKEWREF
ncbi:MAG: hypothetical protein WCX69_01185 [Candidatus Paceibacterota bacterium]